MLSFVFWVCIAVQLGYVCVFFWRVFSLPGDSYRAQGERQQASVIICARNEAESLARCLPRVLEQKYFGPGSALLFEVVVVDNGSTDDTMGVLKRLQQQYGHLVIVSEPKEGKKHALKAGVATARHNWLVFTDADCAPDSANWLKLLVRPLAAGKEIVAGYSGYYHAPGLLNAFTRWETLHTFVQYSTYALAGMPYMAVGRNMACTRRVAETAIQHPLWQQLPYGDDDLLVNIAGNRKNTTVMCLPGSFTYSTAKTTWKEWARQKQRHLSAGKHYRLSARALLGLYGVSHAALWLVFFFMLATPMAPVAAMAMGIRCVVYWHTWYPATATVSEESLIFFFPFFDLGWMIYNFAFLPYIMWKNKKNWK